MDLSELDRPGLTKVTIVADPAHQRDEVASARRTVRPGVQVEVVDHDVEQGPDLHLALLASAPHEVVVDLTAAARVRRLAVLLAHLPVGGRLLMRLPSAGPVRAAFEALVADVRRLRAGPDLDPPRLGAKYPRSREDRELHSLAASCEELTLTGDVLSATNAAAVLPKVSEGGVGGVLVARPGLGSTVRVEPAATLAPSGAWHSSDDEPPMEAVAAPELSLREYVDVVCAPRMVALSSGGFVLPESFRAPRRPRTHNPALQNWTPTTVLDDPALRPTTTLEGTYFYLDNVERGHFGHAMTEQLSHLWAWEESLRRHPDLRVLVGAASTPVAEWELELLAAAGVERERVVAITEPVVVERLVTASPAYVISSYVHPVVRDVYRRVRDGLDTRPATERPSRVFLTRHGQRRACRNRVEVEQRFTDHGFTVLRPEQFSLAEQVALVDGADVVAGFSGSGTFHLGLTRTPKKVAVITSDTYHSLNERWMCQLGGHDLTMVRGRSEIRSSGRFTSKAFQSPFSIDFAQEGRLLDDWLDDLDR